MNECSLCKGNNKDAPCAYSTEVSGCLRFKELQAKLLEAEKPIKEKRCYWCGNIKAGFYHVACAQKMSKLGRNEYKTVVLMLQDLIEEQKIKLDRATVNDKLRDALHDCSSALEYIKMQQGELPGVEYDRALSKASAALGL